MNDPQSRFWISDSDIRRFLSGQLAAAIGSRITREGLPIVAITAASATAPQLGILAALATLPALLVGNAAGHVVDRVRRRPILIGANLARAAILLILPALYILHHLSFWPIAAVTALASAAALLAAVARHAYLPFLVTRQRLEDGNELLGTAESIGETTGPGLMGILIQWVGAPFAILFDAASNLAAALSLIAVKRQEPEPSPASSVPRNAPLRPSVGNVWARVTRHPVLRPLLFNAGAGAFFGGFFSTLYELYVLKTLHLAPLWLGLLITLGGLGSLAGTRLFRLLRRRLSLESLIFAGYLIFAVLNVSVPMARGSLAFFLLLIGQFGGDLFATIFDIAATTVEQQVTPDQWLGRVHGTFRALGGGLEVLGALIAGPLALAISIRGALWISVGGFLVSAFFLRSPALAQNLAAELSSGAESRHWG